MRSLRPLLFDSITLLLGFFLLVACRQTALGLEPKTDEKPEYETVYIKGRIVWMSDVLEKRFGVKIDPDSVHTQAVLETSTGEVYPLVKDLRGRGFWMDKRLRDVPVELLVRRYPTAGMIQVIRVYMFQKSKKYEFDYWCDICAIPMYELKECECCQGPIRPRYRLVPPGETEPLPEK